MAKQSLSTLPKIQLKSLIFYLSLTLGYLAAIVLMLGYFHNMDRRNNIMAEYELERTAFTLLELFRESWLPENLAELENVQGFGIYSGQGLAILTWGSAPPGLTAGQIGRLPVKNNYRSFQYAQNESMQLTMRIHLMPSQTAPMRRMMQRREEAPSYLFLEQGNPQYWQSFRHTRNARYFIPAILLILLVFIIVLYKKNYDYRQRLTTQQELVRLGEISRTLSHEIKNPLSAIRIQTGILKKTAPPDREVPQELFIIEEEVERLGMLTRRISDFVKDPLGQPEKIHLESFLAALIQRFDFTITLKNKTGHELSVLADKERLRSVVENILKNGIESYRLDAGSASEPPSLSKIAAEAAAEMSAETTAGTLTGKATETTPGPSPTVEIELRQTPAGPLIAVLDRGSGIDPGLGEKIFEPSYSSKLAGTGIGLAIAQRFMEALQGKVLILPRPGGGTEVQICFRKV